MSAERYLIWDFDGTLAVRQGGWLGTICETVLREYPERHPDPERIRPYLRRGFPWHSPDVIRPSCTDQEWWEALHPVLDEALVGGVGLSASEAQRLIETVRAVYLDPTRWQVFEDVIPVLSELRANGWTHLVLSNHVPELARIVDVLGLGGYITAIYNSARTGIEKPNPQAFEQVFTDFPAARDGWMIGDNWHADVKGAEAVGLRSLLVRREHADAETWCETLREVGPIVAER